MDAAEIDVLNILQASLLAMRRALLGLAVAPARVCVDGNRCPDAAMLGLGCEIEAIVGGDAACREISAASILAKTARDAFMTRVAGSIPAMDSSTTRATRPKTTWRAWRASVPAAFTGGASRR